MKTHKLKKVIIIALLFCLTFEVIVGVTVELFDLKVNTPSYNLQNVNQFWIDADTLIGTIHRPNQTYVQRKSCFQTTYNSNSLGFRDGNNKYKFDGKRVVVLGDSFMEGVGVDTVKRTSNLLEQKTGIKHLNFGMAGNFGSTQYWLTYQKFAKRFDHDAILIGFLPSNDFIEDDFEKWSSGNNARYRPYLVGEYPDYRLTHFDKKYLRSLTKSQNSKIRLKSLLKNFLYTYNFFIYTKTFFSIAFNQNLELQSFRDLDGYFHFSNENLNRVRYALMQIKSLAPDKKIMVFTIPTYNDLSYSMNFKGTDVSKPFSELCSDLDIEYLDILSSFIAQDTEDFYDLYLKCDGHWSATGHKRATELISKKFTYYKSTD